MPLPTSCSIKYLSQKNMGKRGRDRRASNLTSVSHKPISLREEKAGKKLVNTTNVKSKLKLEHLQRLAVWASSETCVPSLAALFGHRLASANEVLGLQPDPSFFSCQRFCLNLITFICTTFWYTSLIIQSMCIYCFLIDFRLNMLLYLYCIHVMQYRLMYFHKCCVLFILLYLHCFDYLYNFKWV